VQSLFVLWSLAEGVCTSGSTTSRLSVFYIKPFLTDECWVVGSCSGPALLLSLLVT
jgi:hypothetical protein